MAELTVPSINFSALGELGNEYKKAQADAIRQQTLANLGQGGQVDADTLLRSGDLSLAQLGISLRNRQEEQARQARQDAFQREESARAQRNADRSYGLQVRAADRADEDKPVLKEVSRPDGTTEIYRIAKDGTATRVNTGAVQPIDPATNPKNPFNTAMLKQDAERVNSYSEGAKLAEEGGATLDQIDALRKQAFTAPVIGPLASKVGYPANQALDAAANQLSLDVAQKMKGSLSDKDIAFVKSQIPTAATGGAAGESASGLIRSGFERSRQRAAFYRTWAEKNGNINGADAAWNRYINENPLTIEDPKALGGRKFNPDYNKDFSSYIKGGQSGQGNGADSMLAFAREAIAQGAPRAAVLQRLKDAGIDASGL